MDAGFQNPGNKIGPLEILRAFEELQRKLVPMWEMIGRIDPGGPPEEDNTIVVVPSLTVDMELQSAKQQAYEERLLFLLFLLRQPKIRLIYITSQTIQPEIIDYYLDILPGVVISNARKRLSLVSPQDSSSRPLTRKLLDRPKLIQHIRSLIPDLERAHMVPFNTTDLERELAVRLGIPMYAADPRFFCFGTKSGGRKIFIEEGVPHPIGFENLFNLEAVIEAVERMRVQRSTLRKVIVKLNEGVSGMGNATVNLERLPDPGDPSEIDIISDRLRSMKFELEDVQFDTYLNNLEKGGAIVEEMIEGEEFHSPSAQLRVTPLGEVEMLSTHDQMLGGPGGQSYLGARFPADPAYSWLIMREALKIGKRLAREGIVGRFAVDFVVVRTPEGEWEPYAIEVNLRKGGTTAPFLTLQYLTDGIYDPEAGVFTTVRGQQKCYVASDHVDSHLYQAFTPDDLFDIVSRHRLHFDHASHTGVVLHMLSGVAGLGSLGVTAIADTLGEANILYRRFIAVLEEEGEAAIQ